MLLFPCINYHTLSINGALIIYIIKMHMVIFSKCIYFLIGKKLFWIIIIKRKKNIWFGIWHSTSCLVALATTTENTIKKKKKIQSIKNNNCMLKLVEIIKYL